MCFVCCAKVRSLNVRAGLNLGGRLLIFYKPGVSLEACVSESFLFVAWINCTCIFLAVWIISLQEREMPWLVDFKRFPMARWCLTFHMVEKHVFLFLFSLWEIRSISPPRSNWRGSEFVQMHRCPRVAFYKLRGTLRVTFVKCPQLWIIRGDFWRDKLDPIISYHHLIGIIIVLFPMDHPWNNTSHNLMSHRSI